MSTLPLLSDQDAADQSSYSAAAMMEFINSQDAGIPGEIMGGIVYDPAINLSLNNEGGPNFSASGDITIAGSESGTIGGDYQSMVMNGNVFPFAGQNSFFSWGGAALDLKSNTFVSDGENWAITNTADNGSFDESTSAPQFQSVNGDLIYTPTNSTAFVDHQITTGFDFGNFESGPTVTGSINVGLTANISGGDPYQVADTGLDLYNAATNAAGTLGAAISQIAQLAEPVNIGLKG